MTSSQEFDADTGRLLAHARALAGFDEARRTLAAEFDAAAATVRANHAAGRASPATAKLAQLAAALDDIDHVALIEIERFAATLSEITGRA